MEIKSREMMKPSSPTPQHLHKHKLSFLDQQAPPTYVFLLFFYEPPSSNQSSIDLSRKLKQSLSRVLTKFYPLAGRIVNDDGQCYVDCNDEGVEYVETRVHARMSDVINDPDPVDLQKYGWNPSMGEEIILPLSIHVSTFECGGVAVGPCMAHKIGDMASLVMFMTDWSTACRMQRVELASPDFDALSSRFPPRPEGAVPPPPVVDDDIDRGRHDDDVVVVTSKRFVFDKGMLSELKRVGSSREVENPSRVEAVTAFVWARRMHRDSVAHHAVNVRPAHDDGSGMARGFGNGCTPAVARWSSSGVEEDRGNVIRTMTGKLRAAVKKAKANERAICDSEGVVDSVDVCIFSSWCRFPVYSVDYGWGRPSWVGTAGVPFKNVIVFMDTKNGDGVEAWVNMGEEDIAMVEENYERLRSKLF